MSQKTNNVPLLRFGNFKDSWNQQKLNDFAVINPDSNKLPEQFIYIDLECVNSGELLFENTVFRSDAPSRAQRLLEIGDVLFQMVRPYQKNNYYFNKIGDYVASTGYAQIRTDQDSKYLYQYIHFQKFVDRVIERCTGTSYPAINSTDLSNIPISFPS
ncbi:MAG TPA: restriction endonuclease subunit S, partial [Spirochaetota bacterium]|nr:restriction endonuclease subunit S [Spirochaetota bacterium]